MITELLLKLLLNTFVQHLVTLHHPLFPLWVFLTLVNISDFNIKKSVKRLRQIQSVWRNDIPGFIIKECSVILMLVLKYIFNLRVSQQHLLTQSKLSEMMSVYNQGDKASVPIPILNHFSTAFEFVMHNNLSYHLKFKLNPRQHSFFFNPN
jgi:hypothetical protein